MGGKHTFWRIGLFSLCLDLYHLSSIKKRFVADIFIPSGSSFSFSFGFRCSLFIGEMMNVVAFLPLIGEFEFRLERRDVRLWCPNSSGGFSLSFLFHRLLDLSASSKFVFLLYERWKLQRRLNLSFGRWSVEKLILLIGLLERCFL